MIELGLPQENAVGMVNNIIQLFVNSIKIDENILSKNNDIVGGIHLYILNEDLHNLLTSESAVVKTKSGTIPWLDWLITKGDSIIVDNHSILYGDFEISRSGGGIMVKSKSTWKVPSNFSGTIEDNWFTRVLLHSSSFLQKNLQDILDRKLFK